MSRFIRSQGRLLRQFWANARVQFVQQQSRYSQKSIPEPTVSRKKKYLYCVFLGASAIAFGYYVNKEREYGSFLLKLNNALTQTYLDVIAQ